MRVGGVKKRERERGRGKSKIRGRELFKYILRAWVDRGGGGRGGGYGTGHCLGVHLFPNRERDTREGAKFEICCCCCRYTCMPLFSM